MQDKESHSNGSTLMNFGLFAAGLALGAGSSRMLFERSSIPKILDQDPPEPVGADMIIQIQLKIRFVIFKAIDLYEALSVDGANDLKTAPPSLNDTIKAERLKILKEINLLCFNSKTLIGETNVQNIIYFLKNMSVSLLDHSQCFFNVLNAKNSAEFPLFLLSRNEFPIFEPNKAVTDKQVLEALTCLIREVNTIIEYYKFE
jgi:hypothetical protein